MTVAPVVAKRKLRNVSRLTLASVVALAFAAAVACTSKVANAGADQPSAEPKVDELSDSALIQVPHPEQFALVTATMQDVPDQLSGTCVVNPDVNRTVPVNALGGGRVVQLRASLGDHVQQGQTLVVIGSPDLADALSAYQKAHADATLADKQLDRSRLLLEHGSIARKDLETAEDAARDADIDLRTSAERVRMLGGDTTQTEPYIELKAPIAGTIIEQNVTQAAGVKSPDNAPNLFTIADLSHVWVLCDVYENDLSHVHLGERARVRLAAYPDRPLAGTIANISQALDSTTRTAKMRVEMDNPDGIMKVGMFATATLVSPSQQRRIVLPTDALLRIHDADWVFVQREPKSFRRVRIVTGASVAGASGGSSSFEEVLSGLTPGDRVVKNALQFAQAVENR